MAGLGWVGSGVPGVDMKHTHTCTYSPLAIKITRTHTHTYQTNRMTRRIISGIGTTLRKEPITSQEVMASLTM